MNSTKQRTHHHHLRLQYMRNQTATIDTTNTMTKVQTKLLQQVCETFLYYAKAVDCTILHALNNLATRVNDST